MLSRQTTETEGGDRLEVRRDLPVLMGSARGRIVCSLTMTIAEAGKETTRLFERLQAAAA